jgi:hypothetical protein
MNGTKFFLLASSLCLGINGTASAQPKTPVFADWHASPKHFAGIMREKERITLDSTKWNAPENNPGRWAFTTSADEHADVALAATITIQQAAKSFRFFGESWSVWPDATYGDQGFEAALLVRAQPARTASDGVLHAGYRVQISHKYQCVALVKYPDGGYVRVVPAEIKLNQPLRLHVSAQGNEIVVRVDDREKIRYSDTLLPIAKGRLGLGVSSGAKISVSAVTLEALPSGKVVAAKPHQPNFSVRTWIGGRPWVFDGDEPILLVPVPEANGINNVKLKPGYKPQLSWNSHWDIQNQGAFSEGTNKNGPTTTSGGGEMLVAKWTARQTKDRFVTRTTLTVGWDKTRGVYRYDVDSELEVLAAEPFHFRYGFDFEHHTPLDPFNWQYLVVQREGGKLERRPVYPIDPGPMNGVEQYQGLRMWYGRHNEEMQVAPAVEYNIDPELNKDKTRKLTTAVCAAFYDTGVSFEPETAKPGTKVRVKYRYTGYPADEAKRVFEASKSHESFMLDAKHHYIFAEWPTLTMRDHVPTDQTWIYGKTPFMSGHNQRPTYELAAIADREPGLVSGRFAMKLGPASFGAARMPIADPLKKGRYMILAECKSVNTHGPGGRIELTVTEPKTAKPIATHKHYVGNGTFAWKTLGFAFEVPHDGCGLTLGFGNAGTGAAYFTQVTFLPLLEFSGLPKNIAAKASGAPTSEGGGPKGLIADYRMVEQKGQHALDFAGGPFGLLELANLDWVIDQGRPAIKIADNTTARKEYPRAGTIERNYLGHASYKDRQSVPAAIAGMHGGGIEWKAFTVAAFIKPAKEMGKSTHGGKGDILGVGARRFILSLYGQQAPYRLGARLNVNDAFIADKTKLEAERWYHVAMTGEPTAEKKWRVKLYVDGVLVQECVTQKFEAPTTIPPSLILGAEIFYLHDAYYRGLIGRTLIFNRVLDGEELAGLAKQ